MASNSRDRTKESKLFEDAEGREDKEEDYDVELDFFSANFNPLRALYATNVKVPYPEVKRFSSLEEYEEALKKRQSLKTGQKESPQSLSSSNNPSTVSSTVSRTNQRPSSSSKDQSSHSSSLREQQVSLSSSKRDHHLLTFSSKKDKQSSVSLSERDLQNVSNNDSYFSSSPSSSRSRENEHSSYSLNSAQSDPPEQNVEVDTRQTFAFGRPGNMPAPRAKVDIKGRQVSE